MITRVLENLLRACALDLKGNWDYYLPLVEFAYKTFHILKFQQKEKAQYIRAQGFLFEPTFSPSRFSLFFFLFFCSLNKK